MQRPEQLVREHGLQMLRTAYLLTGNRQDAEDLFQETFARITRRRGLVAVKSPSAYLRRVMINIHTDQCRRKTLPQFSMEEVVAEPSSDDEIAKLDDRELLLAELQRLPERQRTAVVLRYFNELDDAEVAESMGISSSSVRSNISRGLDVLRRRISLQQDGMHNEQV